MPNKEDPLCLLLQLSGNKCQIRWFLQLKKKITLERPFLSAIKVLLRK